MANVKGRPSHGLFYVVKNNPKGGILVLSIKKFFFGGSKIITITSPSPRMGSQGCWSPAQLSRRGEGEGGVTPWTSRQLITGPHRETNSHSRSSLTPTENLELPDKPRAHVRGLWEEAGEPADPPAKLRRS